MAPSTLRHHPLPRRAVPVLFLWVLGESIWTFLLGLHLPPVYVADHWDLAWVGLDVAQVLALAGLLVAGLRRSAYSSLFATAAATLLLLDAWFDVTTARRGNVSQSILAALVEVPSACLLLWYATRAQHHLIRPASSHPQDSDVNLPIRPHRALDSHPASDTVVPSDSSTPERRL